MEIPQEMEEQEQVKNVDGVEEEKTVEHVEQDQDFDGVKKVI